MPAEPTRSPTAASPAPAPAAARDRGLWAAYAGLVGLCGALYAMAGAEWHRGAAGLWVGAYEAAWTLGPPALLGCAALPWARRLARLPALPRAAWHVVGALAFVAAWQALDYAAARGLYGPAHADATFVREVLWRAMWGVFVYVALMLGFGGALQARRAGRAALVAAQAEAALVRAELAAISGKLNPHFLFNTLNSLTLLTRRDPAAAERALLAFSRMMRYVLDTARGSGDRVALQDELDFVRDYLELESLRLGPRLRVDWRIDPAALSDPIPPLTLQPLVENSIVHGIAPQRDGGTVCIEAAHSADALALSVADDGAGCDWPAGSAAPAAVPVHPARDGGHGGVGLSALRRRFELDFGGRAAFSVQGAPGAGFRVDIRIPRPMLQD